MPIRIAEDLPAREVLVREGVMVLDATEAARQDIRPLQIGLLNLMPNKIRTETQFARLLGSTPLQIDLTLLRVGGHNPRNTPEDHLIAFYNTWEEVADRKFDGLIVTGAPVETLPYEEVTYWDELRRIFEWTRTNVHSTFSICWGAMAGLQHFHGVPKHTLEKKAFGVFPHVNRHPTSPYLAGFSDELNLCVSRWTDIRRQDISPSSGLDILLESRQTGLCLLSEAEGNRLYMLNHVEYDSTSLSEEYFRDVANGTAINIPFGYFPDDNPENPPLNRWRSHAFLLFGNWINQVYQSTPFDISRIGQGVR
ncbi:MAG: homoserine O-succinyltransferase [Hyphomonadaceae bacterium]